MINIEFDVSIVFLDLYFFGKENTTKCFILHLKDLKFNNKEYILL